MKNKYIDIDLKFSPTGEGDIPTVSNENAINKAIDNILFYKNGEKPFLRGFAVDVNNILFSNVSKIDIIEFKTIIANNLESLEDRITKPVIEINRIDEAIEINITYSLKNGDKFPYSRIIS